MNSKFIKYLKKIEKKEKKQWGSSFSVKTQTQ